jgi:hypothetical protein
VRPGPAGLKGESNAVAIEIQKRRPAGESPARPKRSQQVGSEPCDGGGNDAGDA